MAIWNHFKSMASRLGLGGKLDGVLDELERAPKQEAAGPRRQQVTFTIAVIALGAKMAKADGTVTNDEIDAFKEIFKVPPGEMANVARIFNMAKQDVAGFESYAAQVGRMLAGDRALLEDVLHGLFYIATADNVFHPREEAFLKETASRFGFSTAEYHQVRARFLPADKQDPYLILGIPRDLPDDALKAAYRKLVVENHPDKAMARGLPPEFIKIATAKLAAINEAYEAIRKERGI